MTADFDTAAAFGELSRRMIELSKADPTLPGDLLVRAVLDGVTPDRVAMIDHEPGIGALAYLTAALGDDRQLERFAIREATPDVDAARVMLRHLGNLLRLLGAALDVNGVDVADLLDFLGRAKARPPED